MKLTARAFYDDTTIKGDNQLKSGRTDNRGLAVVVLDALTRYSIFRTFYDISISNCILLGIVSSENKVSDRELGMWLLYCMINVQNL